MNDLNAQQIVLLTLLVSFVTSIATGITTVSLLEQAPDPITQTINRVVEKTVERVLPEEEDDGTTIVRTPEKEIVTVVVNEEERTIQSVEKNSRSLARIYQKVGGQEIFVALGIVFDANGRLVTDSAKVQQKSGNYLAKYNSGTYLLDVEYREANDPYAIMKVQDGQTPPAFTPAVFSNSQNLKLGQSVILLSGDNSNTVSTGIISNLETVNGALDETNPQATPNSQITLIEANIAQSNVLAGSILLNLSGEIIGARLNADPSRTNTFSPANSVSGFLAGK